MRYAVMVCAGLLIFWNSLSGQSSQLKIADWLIGTWENVTPRGTIYEEWSRDAEPGLNGRSYTIANGDTTVFETIRLVEEGDKLLYIPTVHNQNDGQPVVFSSEKLSATKMVFSNPDHDFPQYISYTKTAADSLTAEIYGTVNGEERRVTFRMRKVK